MRVWTRGLSGVLWLVVLLAGCSNFESEFAKSQAKREELTNLPVAGAWEGRWRDTVSGRSGRVRAIVHRPGVLEGEFHPKYHVRFRADWFYAEEFDVVFDAAPAAGGLTLEGASDLGVLAGGKYTFHGRIANGRMTLEYSSNVEAGTMALTPVVQGL